MNIYKFSSKKIIFILLFVSCLSGFSQDSTKVQKFIKQTDISGQWFLAYNYNITDNFNQFKLKRGYFTIKTDLSPNISMRYTQDITLDNEGSDAGNVEIRLKYLYMKFKGPNDCFLRNTYLEFGLVHRPWLDFEQKINGFRVYEKMFSEKYQVLNSADFGITFGGNIGGELSKDIQKNLGKEHSGKFGSYTFGIYNGGGYHAIEYNNNKTFEARISLRPLPDLFPGIQLNYVSSIGKSNIETNPGNFNLNLFYLSTKSKYHTFTAQYFFGKGNYTGEYYDVSNIPHENEGISLFAEIRLPKTDFSVFSRYDFFGLQQDNYFKKEAFGGGLAYHFLKNKFVVFYQTDFYSGYRDIFVEAALEIAF
ncbi:MAG: hypothetical protein JXR68_14360 [Bacteroidales bacterium]|nr:hypothetical protein [Bacteroidales bacterium]